jgi:hypothetical protein
MFAVLIAIEFAFLIPELVPSIQHPAPSFAEYYNSPASHIVLSFPYILYAAYHSFFRCILRCTLHMYLPLNTLYTYCCLSGMFWEIIITYQSDLHNMFLFITILCTNCRSIGILCTISFIQILCITSRNSALHTYIYVTLASGGTLHPAMYLSAQDNRHDTSIPSEYSASYLCLYSGHCPAYTS